MTTPKRSSSNPPIHRPELFRISCSLLAESVNLPPLLVIPEQVTNPQRPATGTRSLMLAVLGGAIQDFQQRRAPASRSRRLAREAENWIWSDTTSWPFSFVNICDALGFSPSYLRTQLLLRQESVQRDPGAEKSAA